MKKRSSGFTVVEVLIFSVVGLMFMVLPVSYTHLTLPTKA